MRVYKIHFKHKRAIVNNTYTIGRTKCNKWEQEITDNEKLVTCSFCLNRLKKHK